MTYTTYRRRMSVSESLALRGFARVGRMPHHQPLRPTYRDCQYAINQLQGRAA